MLKIDVLLYDHKEMIGFESLPQKLQDEIVKKSIDTRLKERSEKGWLKINSELHSTVRNYRHNNQLISYLSRNNALSWYELSSLRLLWLDGIRVLTKKPVLLPQEIVVMV